MPVLLATTSSTCLKLAQPSRSSPLKHERNDDRYIPCPVILGSKCRARDTFVSLPGLTLSIEETHYFELVMKTAERALREFMEGKPNTTKMAEVEQPDVFLWAVWAFQQYARKKARRPVWINMVC